MPRFATLMGVAVRVSFVAAADPPKVLFEVNSYPISGGIDAGIGIVDITPTGPITLAGSPSPKKASEVKTRLYVRALVLSAGGKKVAIITLDTLKYPVDLAVGWDSRRFPGTRPGRASRFTPEDPTC